MSTVLQKVLSIQSHNTSLIGLGNISENGIHHADLKEQNSRVSKINKIFFKDVCNLPACGICEDDGHLQ